MERSISDVLGIKPDKEILIAHFDDFYREHLIAIKERKNMQVPFLISS